MHNVPQWVVKLAVILDLRADSDSDNLQCCVAAGSRDPTRHCTAPSEVGTYSARRVYAELSCLFIVVVLTVKCGFVVEAGRRRRIRKMGKRRKGKQEIDV